MERQITKDNSNIDCLLTNHLSLAIICSLFHYTHTHTQLNMTIKNNFLIQKKVEGKRSNNNNNNKHGGSKKKTKIPILTQML